MSFSLCFLWMASGNCGFIIFIKFGKIWLLLLQIFFLSPLLSFFSFENFDYTYVRPFKGVPQFTGALFIFLSFFSPYVSFGVVSIVYVFKFLKIFFPSIFKSTVNPIHFVLHLSHHSFHFYKVDLDLFLFNHPSLFLQLFEHIRYSCCNWFHVLVFWHVLILGHFILIINCIL